MKKHGILLWNYTYISFFDKYFQFSWEHYMQLLYLIQIFLYLELSNNEPNMAAFTPSIIYTNRFSYLWTRQSSESRSICIMRCQHFYWPKSKHCRWRFVIIESIKYRLHSIRISIDRNLSPFPALSSLTNSRKLMLFAFQLQLSPFKDSCGMCTNVSLPRIL